MDRYEIRRLALEHLLTEWQGDGWEVDHARGEVSVGGSWFPVESLPRILDNHMRAVNEARRDEKAALELAMRQRVASGRTVTRAELAKEST